MSTETRPAGEPQESGGENRRRSQRVMIRIAVRLHFAIQEKPESVPGRTVAVNDHGALIICARVFPGGTRVDVENEQNHRTQKGHVVRAPKLTPLGFEVPVEFEQVFPGFWGIAFPPPDWQPAQD